MDRPVVELLLIFNSHCDTTSDNNNVQLSCTSPTEMERDFVGRASVGDLSEEGRRMMGY